MQNIPDGEVFASCQIRLGVYKGHFDSTAMQPRTQFHEPNRPRTLALAKALSCLLLLQVLLGFSCLAYPASAPPPVQNQSAPAAAASPVEQSDAERHKQRWLLLGLMAGLIGIGVAHRTWVGRKNF